MRVAVTAPAKLNLSLDIIGRRADGYHLLKMITQSVDLCDTVTVSTEDDDDVPIRLLCDNNIPTDGENTAYKAARLFFEETETPVTPISIKIKKRIPVSAGLGGGSADAAAVIVALNELFSTDLSYDEMCAIGEKVGSDVPACIVGGTALIEGTGAIINPLPDLPECYFVLAKADEKISTGHMYEEIDSREKLTEPDIDAAVDAICDGDLHKACRKFSNVFEELWDNAHVPEIKSIMCEKGAICAVLTGSGPTVFGVFESRSDASECAGTLKKTCEDVYICEPFRKGAVID